MTATQYKREWLQGHQDLRGFLGGVAAWVVIAAVFMGLVAACNTIWPEDGDRDAVECDGPHMVYYNGYAVAAVVPNDPRCPE